MRLGPIPVLTAIVVAIGVIIASQAGWLDGDGSEPAFVVRGGSDLPGTSRPRDLSKVGSTSKHAVGFNAPPVTIPAIVEESGEPTSVGRSVGKNDDSVDVTTSDRGSGGASLDSDGTGGSAAGPADPTAAPDALQQARDEAAKAKQDVLEVTQASIAAQHASEAEFERQKAELSEQIDQLRAKINMSPAQPAKSDATAEAEAKAATATAELADAHQRENVLRAKLAAVQSGADEAARGHGVDKIEGAERALAEAQGRAKAFADQIATLQAEAAANRVAAEKTLAGERTDAAAKAKIASVKIAALEGEVATQAAVADKGAMTEHALGEARARVGELGERIADMQQKLAASEGRERDLGAKLAALTSDRDARTGDAARASDDRSSTTLQSDLAGSRRGEDTLRKENGVLQRELAQERTSNKLMGEKLASLQAGVAQPAPDRPMRRGRGRISTVTSEHELLVRQLDTLRREQMHQEVQALKIEATDLRRPRGRRSPMIAPAEQGVRFVTVEPGSDGRLSPAERRAARRRERQLSRDRDAAFRGGPAVRGARRSLALGQPIGDAAASDAVIAQASGLIRSGNIDQARQLLRQRGGAAVTRALADTYNPLTNTKYGVIGVDSDADKAAFLYQQAARSAR